MKKFKFQRELEKLKDSDFLEGSFDSWEIWIQKDQYSLPYRYMNCVFEFEKSANSEMERIKVQYPKMGRTIYHIEVRHTKIRRLKNPISLS